MRRRAARGRVPHVRADVGRVVRYRFRRSDVLALAPARGDRYVDSAEAACILGVTRGTVLRWANRGAFPAVRDAAPGGPAAYRFARADLEAFVERSRLRPTGGGADGQDPAERPDEDDGPAT